MAIRRISELPNLQAEHEGSAELSDCLFEVSYPHMPNEYMSYYTMGKDVVNGVIHSIETKTMEKLTISAGTLILDNSTLSIGNGSSIMAWPNEPATNTSCYMHFGEIKLSADREFTIDGDPVVINGHLSVYHVRNGQQLTAYTVTDQKVSFRNPGNMLKAQTVSRDNYYRDDYKNSVVTCELLNNTIGAYIGDINRLTTGSGYR